MTKKMTITLEDELIDELSVAAASLGKKKAQIVREALRSYLPAMKKEQMAEQWKKENAEAIAAYNDRIASEGTFADKMRLF